MSICLGANPVALAQLNRSGSVASRAMIGVDFVQREPPAHAELVFLFKVGQPSKAFLDEIGALRAREISTRIISALQDIRKSISLTPRAAALIISRISERERSEFR